jgi:hypothetical protein
MDLAHQVDILLESVMSNQNCKQSQSIEYATKIFESLREQGLVDAPTYKLAPLNSVPPKESFLPAKTTLG